MIKTEKKPPTAAVLSFLGGFLILINIILVASNWGPIIISSYSVNSIEEIISDKSQLWMRISFGMRGFVEGIMAPLGLILAGIILYCSLMLWLKPTSRKYVCPVIIFLSIFSLVYGGGFVIGFLLTFLGGGIGFEWPSHPSNTFFGRAFRAMRFDLSLYDELKGNVSVLKHAAYLILFVNLLSGIGNSIYSYNVNKILSAQPSDVPFRILLLGEIFFDVSTFAPILINTGLGIVKWLILTFIIYLVGIKLAGGNASFEDVGIGISFSYVPVSLQLFMPLIFTSKPHLTFTWPFTAFAITNIWMLTCLFGAVRKMLNLPFTKVLGVLLISGTIYFLINDTFFTSLMVPLSIKFLLEPKEIFVLIASCLVITGTLLGTFSRR